MSVVVDGVAHPLDLDADGIYSGVAPGQAGSRYGFLLGDSPRVLPDPASRFQPDGVDGLSEVIDPRRYQWHDDAWAGRDVAEHVLYELHCGTFTAAGTWKAALPELASLATLGVTTLQVMPVNTFAGAYGWGYDGVFWYAPHPAYGRPDDFRAFVDEAHRVGLAVVLDVVYNHFGPRGCVLRDYGSAYFAEGPGSEWGDGPNIDGPNAGPVRRLVIENAAYWMRDFHLDGLRIDATQQIRDSSPVHLVTEVTRAARRTGRHPHVLVIGENEPQDVTLLQPPGDGGSGLDLLYNDDFHHTSRVRLTGWRDAYYSDYSGSAQELASCLRFGFLFQGQYYPWQAQRRGTSAIGIDGHRFLCCLENHDQVANSDRQGRRLSTMSSPQLWRACTALLLLGPWTPLLFQGQEFDSAAPWLYFADHPGDLGRQVNDGRQDFLDQFRRLRRGTGTGPPDATAAGTFERCALRRPANGVDSTTSWRLHADLLTLRRRLRAQADAQIEVSAPGPDLLLMHVWQAGGEYLVAVNFGPDVDLAPLADPLVAPRSRGQGWQLTWSSEDMAYGGGGAPAVEATAWWAAGHATTVFYAPDTSGGTR